MMTIENCICKHTEVKNRFSKQSSGKQITYLQCSNCCSYRMLNPPSNEEIVKYYNNEKDTRLTPGFKNARKRTTLENISAIRSYLKFHKTSGKKPQWFRNSRLKT